MKLTLADLQRFDPYNPQPDKANQAWLCPLCGDGHARDAAHRSLKLHVETGKWQCHRCGQGGVLQTEKPPVKDRRAKRGKRMGTGTTRRPAERATVEKSASHRVELPEEASARLEAHPGDERGIAGPPARLLGDTQAQLSQVPAPVKAALMAAGGGPLVGSPGAEYLWGRGIRLEVAHAAGVRWASFYQKQPSVLFPIRDRNGALVAVQGRRVKDTARPKAITIGARNRGVFATEGAWESGVVILCEGPLDALSLAQAGFPAIAVLGTDLQEWQGWALFGKHVLVASDADEAGDKAAERWTQMLESRAAEPKRLRPPDDGRDWNDYLVERGEEWLRDWVKARISEAWPETVEAPKVSVGEMRISDFAVSGRVVLVESELLGERIAMVADNAERPAGVVTYSAAELARVSGLDAEHVKMTHAVKAIFGGEVVTGAETGVDTA